MVGGQANQRLQQRRRQLVGQRDEADLHKAQVKVALEDRVHRQNQRLHHVVDHVRGADGAQNAVLGLGGLRRAERGGRAGHWEGFLEEARTVDTGSTGRLAQQNSRFRTEIFLATRLTTHRDVLTWTSLEVVPITLDGALHLPPVTRHP